MAFEQELLALLPRLRRFARGLTQHPADADDLCQAAIERALKRDWIAGCIGLREISGSTTAGRQRDGVFMRISTMA